MFVDKYEKIDVGKEGLGAPPPGPSGSAGKKCRLLTNCFRLQMRAEASIHHYKYELFPPAATVRNEQLVLQEVWSQLQTKLQTFVFRVPCHVFSPTLLPAGEQAIVLSAGPQFAGTTVSVRFHQSVPASRINAGHYGEAEVVAKHVIKRMAASPQYQKVGRRYFNDTDAVDGRSQLTIFSGFQAALLSPNLQVPLLQIDTVYRALHKKTVLEEMCALTEVETSTLKFDQDAMNEWQQRCHNATVVTSYNNRIYCIKAVHFDMSPETTFMYWERDVKAKNEMTFAKFYLSYYQRRLADENQPLLEAYPEKSSEKVFLVPELCVLTGFNDEMRKDKNIMAEAMKQTRVSPQERLNAITNLTADILNACSGSAGARAVAAPAPADWSAAGKTMREWNMAIEKEPLEVEARILEPLEVSFGQKKYSIEEGSFQRWMRNGLQCPTKFDDWIFIYPETDVPVLDIWLRSLRDIAQVAFTMKMSDPTRISCSDQRNEIASLLEQRLTPQTQMVLLLTPQKDAKRVYQIFKQCTVSKFPCITQVVKSETIRKRQSIAAVLSRIVLQINAKFCGPLWHLELKCPVTRPLFSSPTMAIGVDIHTLPSGEQYAGFAASLDTQCTEYYSNASLLHKGYERQSLSVKLQEWLRDALMHFVRRSDGLLPEYVVVYRASVQPHEWAAVKATEIDPMLDLLKAIQTPDQERYEPKLTFVAISKSNAGMRFFQPSPNQHNVKNPEPGTVVDSPLVGRSECQSFFLMNQAVGKGTTMPMQYCILFDSANLPPNALQNLSYRLSYLYFNFTGAVKLPAPAQYARKIAHHIATAVKGPVHPRLLCTFFYL